MALNGDDLGTAIKNAINGLSASEKEDLETVWQTIGGALVSYITSNAEVTTTVASGIPLTTPDNINGATTGTGTGEGTIS